MTDDQRAGLSPILLDEHIVWARQIAERLESEHLAAPSFAKQLAAKSLRQHISEMEEQVAERDARIRAEMHGKPTPIYDKLKAEGLDPPATVMLVGTRPLSEAEVAYALSLEQGRQYTHGQSMDVLGMGRRSGRGSCPGCDVHMRSGRR